jgi:site-specific DNA recombinase
MSKLNVAYLRVSTESQTEKYGLDVQRQKILDYCERKGVKIDKWYIDGGYSGSKLDRPEIKELLDHAEKGLIGTVYIYKLDRMSRDVIDTLNLFYKILPKYGVKVVSMTEDLRTDNPMDRVMLTMNAAMNQYEREVIRMRMTAGMIERVKKGFWMGGGLIPWGYYYDRNDGILHVDQKEAEMVRKAFNMYLDGYSCENIAKIVGFKSEKIVRDILKRKSNIGMIEYKGKVYKGKHEPIIDEATFNRVQDLMRKRTTNSHVNHDNLLTGLCYCGVCGARMRYQKWGNYHKIVCYSQYKNKEYMQRSDHCYNLKPFASDIEAEVEDCFKRFLINIDNQDEPPKNHKEEIEESIKKSSAKVKRLYMLYADNPSDNLLEVIKEEEDKICSLKKQLELEIENDRRSDTEKIEKIKRMSDVWDTLTVRDKNRVLKECIERIIITGSDIEIRFITL